MCLHYQFIVIQLFEIIINITIKEIKPI